MYNIPFSSFTYPYPTTQCHVSSALVKASTDCVSTPGISPLLPKVFTLFPTRYSYTFSVTPKTVDYLFMIEININQ